MKFGEKIRALRQAAKLGQRALADKVGVSFTYISKIENSHLSFGEYPAEEMVVKLAQALESDVDELLLLAQKMPQRIRKRVMERPDAFLKLAGLDDAALDLVLRTLDRKPTKSCV
jgi:HTH-type transcriptional regulator, competence development regulator